MRYVTTNIRLPEELWKNLKMEAVECGKRFSEIVRQRLAESWSRRRKTPARKNRSLCGIWKGVVVPDKFFEEAKKSLFPPVDKFLNP